MCQTCQGRWALLLTILYLKLNTKPKRYIISEICIIFTPLKLLYSILHVRVHALHSLSPVYLWMFRLFGGSYLLGF